MYEYSDPAKPTVSSLVLVTGGARSGKSSFAEQYMSEMEDYQAARTVYLATSQIHDDEMKQRVKMHREGRPADWRTIEEPYELETVIQQLGTETVSAVIIDCITLWITNLLLAPELEEEEQMGHSNQWNGREPWRNPGRVALILKRAAHLANLLKQAPFTTIVVTNEVGDSIVPEYPLGRAFRDLAGQVNQLLAARADRVFWVVCGIPVNVREAAWRPAGTRRS